MSLGHLGPYKYDLSGVFSYLEAQESFTLALEMAESDTGRLQPLSNLEPEPGSVAPGQVQQVRGEPGY